MERLTYFDNGKWRLKIGDTEYSGEAVDRLAAYEETGLEPCDYSAMDHALKQAARAREDLTEMIRQIGATGLDRFRELAQADREGRCVVLPCKIGDIVYEIRYTAENDRPRKHARKRFDHSVSGCTWRMRGQPEMCYVSEKKCTKSDFEFMGRTVFLTREEAEDALRREQDG